MENATRVFHVFFNDNIDNKDNIEKRNMLFSFIYLS